MHFAVAPCPFIRHYLGKWGHLSHSVHVLYMKQSRRRRIYAHNIAPFTCMYCYISCSLFPGSFSWMGTTFFDLKLLYLCTRALIITTCFQKTSPSMGNQYLLLASPPPVPFRGMARLTWHFIMSMISIRDLMATIGIPKVYPFLCIHW
jgi:hypothetical protein